MSDLDYLARINEIVEHELAVKKKSDTVWNRRDALLEVKKSIEKMQNEQERIRYLHVLDIELIHVGAEIEEKAKYQFDSDRNTYRVEGHFRYDLDKGELHIVDGMMQEVIKVRQKMEDNLTRRAIVLELEQLGYTVIPPK